MNFYSPEEVIVAYNEKAIDMHAEIGVRLPVDKQDPSKGYEMKKTTAGRIIVNQYVPDEVPYVNEFSERNPCARSSPSHQEHRCDQNSTVPGRHQEPGLRPGVQRRYLVQPRRCHHPCGESNLIEEGYKQVAAVKTTMRWASSPTTSATTK